MVGGDGQSGGDGEPGRSLDVLLEVNKYTKIFPLFQSLLNHSKAIEQPREFLKRKMRVHYSGRFVELSLGVGESIFIDASGGDGGAGGDGGNQREKANKNTNTLICL